MSETKPLKFSDESSSDGEHTEGSKGMIRSLYPYGGVATILLDMRIMWIAWTVVAAALWVQLAAAYPDWAKDMMRQFVEPEGEEHGKNILCFRTVCCCLALINLFACGGVFAAGHVLDSHAGFEFTEENRPLVSDSEMDGIRSFAKLILYASPCFALSCVIFMAIATVLCTGAPVGVVTAYCMGCVLPYVWSAYIAYGVILITWRISRAAVQTVITEVDDVYAKAKSTGTCESGLWPRMTGRFLHMDTALERVWASIAPLLLIIFLSLVALVATLALVAFASNLTGHTIVSCIILFVAFFGCALFLGALMPMAEITDMCNRMSAIKPSLRRSAGNCSAIPWPYEVQVELQLYLQTLDRTPLGVQLPLLGQISTAMLVSKASLLATAAPVILSIFAGVFKQNGN